MPLLYNIYHKLQSTRCIINPKEFILSQNNEELIYDVNVEMRVVLGDTSMLLKDILRLGEGSIVTLEKNYGEYVDIYIGNNLFAKGEVISIDDNYGIRVTKIFKK